MSKKIYVGNLSFNTGESELNTLFSTYGEIISTKLIQNPETGRSKGFAFIEMANDNDVASAINGLNGKEVDGRTIKVNEALNRPKFNNYRNNY